MPNPPVESRTQRILPFFRSIFDEPLFALPAVGVRERNDGKDQLVEARAVASASHWAQRDGGPMFAVDYRVFFIRRAITAIRPITPSAAQDDDSGTGAIRVRLAENKLKAGELMVPDGALKRLSVA